MCRTVRPFCQPNDECRRVCRRNQSKGTSMTEATPEEWEEFNRVERESKAKQESIRGIKRPTREQLMAEVTILTELVRVLSDRVAELEKNT